MKCPKCKTEIKLFKNAGKKGGLQTSVAKKKAARENIRKRWAKARGKLLFLITLAIAACSPQNETWLVVGQSNMETGTVAFAFAKAMQEVGRPINLLNATKGGSRVECWLEGESCYENYILPYKEGAFTVDGIIFWQGESNAIDYEYESWNYYGINFRKLIEQYRSLFGPIPFVFVTLQNYNPSLRPNEIADPKDVYDEPISWETCREQQFEVLELPDVYAVETRDITHGDIHPSYAYETIGQRLAETYLSEAGRE